MYLTKSELYRVGLKSYGDNVLISDKASIYGAENITLGNNVRIDDFVVLSAGDGGIEIGEYCHIAIFSSLIGKGLIMLKDFSGVSMRCTILSSNADYSGRFMTNPQMPEKYLNTIIAPVTLEKHSLIGAGSIILPGITLGEGAVIGAMSFVKRSIPAFEIWAGNPLRFISKRVEYLLELEKQLRNG